MARFETRLKAAKNSSAQSEKPPKKQDWHSYHGGTNSTLGNLTLGREYFETNGGLDKTSSKWAA